MNKQLIKPLPIKKNGKNGHTILGPVDNLEMYLRPDWWRRIFNSMYLKTDADVVEDKQITKNEVKLRDYGLFSFWKGFTIIFTEDYCAPSFYPKIGMTGYLSEYVSLNIYCWLLKLVIINQLQSK